MSSYQSGSMVHELWLHWFSCCINEQTQSNKKRARRRIRIDRTMIGLPTDFQHTAHIGSSDVELNNSAVMALQNQMQSKGGYETSYTALKVRKIHSQYFRLLLTRLEKSKILTKSRQAPTRYLKLTHLPREIVEGIHKFFECFLDERIGCLLNEIETECIRQSGRFYFFFS